MTKSPHRWIDGYAAYYGRHTIGATSVTMAAMRPIQDDYLRLIVATEIAADRKKRKVKRKSSI